MSAREKCLVDGSHVRPCDALQEASEGQRSGGKARGIYVWPLRDTSTGEPTRTMYGAVTSERPNGVIFNYCPWCGADLRASHVAQKNKEGGSA